MLATRASLAVNNSQTGITPRASPQAFQADSVLTQVENTITQASNSLGSPVDSTLPKVESAISQAGNPKAANSQASPADNTLSQAESAISQAGNYQASPVDNTLSQAESAVFPKVFPVVRHSARLRASQASPNSNFQAGNTPMVGSTISQPDSKVSQVASCQANASQEAVSSPFLIGIKVPGVLPPWKNLTQSG